ncbi:SHC SH2 domain-binding protein 1 [Lampris incognitus]|uniref:SHC SH2 domain-binding protein 1 n=1 Tax=Lampris incognitus TaxID=2546036 RepID=UPI0024B61E2D|nr:SHC SH2 domain-binding protein 1 [Lampris incognitus]
MEKETQENTFAVIMPPTTNVETGSGSAEILEFDVSNDETDNGNCVTAQQVSGNGQCDDDDGVTDHFVYKRGTRLQRAERSGRKDACLPDTFQTNCLLFYERFKVYQDYMLGDCKASEARAFIADYLEKVVEQSDWYAVWSTDIFDVLVEVQDVDFKELKACVELVLPIQFETRDCNLDEEALKIVLEATQQKVALLELQVVYKESGDFEQTALAIEHLRFFYKNLWRKWDEDEDDDFDYFVRCVEPRLRLYYDILEDRVAAGLVVEHQSLLVRCAQCFNEFSLLRNTLSSSDSEPENVSMVECLKLFEQMETLKRRLHIIENPLLRDILGCKDNTRQHCYHARGARASGDKMVHVVAISTTAGQLQHLLNSRLLTLCSKDVTEVKFYSDPVLAVNACHQGDVVIILPGHYCVNSSIFVPDSITIEGFGFPDDVVIENKNKGDLFLESTGAVITVSNIKFIQHEAIEGILCVRRGKLEMNNCVLQCETTGVIVCNSAHLTMNRCDIYGSKGAGVEINPGSECILVGNGIHHCKEGILIKEFADDLDVITHITLEDNVIHNNERYGVIVVKPSKGTEPEEDHVPQDNAINDPEDSGGLTAKENLEEEGKPEEEKEVPANPQLNNDLLLTSSTNATSTGITNYVASKIVEDKGAIERKLGATTSARKWPLCQQHMKNKDPYCMPIDEDQVQEMFVSMQGNQFKTNGMGNFGTFLY